MGILDDILYLGVLVTSIAAGTKAILFKKTVDLILSLILNGAL